PGAVEVGAPEFVDLLLAEWYPEVERQRILAGLDELESRCRTRFGKPLAELEDEERREFLGAVDGSRGGGGPGSAEDAYARVKDGLVYGFITSKPIAELTRTTPIIPGRFDGCVPLRSRP
ncbi:MAG TPA: gluconate 2-dehydrogenase subunit 3 family protein, partial [Gemmatimonadales bacterium]|nr:gluconate 2-dehydrogenase subunit 3 family protein [Gemmatimonadales bacterium]